MWKALRDDDRESFRKLKLEREMILQAKATAIENCLKVIAMWEDEHRKRLVTEPCRVRINKPSSKPNILQLQLPFDGFHYH